MIGLWARSTEVVYSVRSSSSELDGAGAGPQGGATAPTAPSTTRCWALSTQPGAGEDGLPADAAAAEALHGAAAGAGGAAPPDGTPVYRVEETSRCWAAGRRAWVPEEAALQVHLALHVLALGAHLDGALQLALKLGAGGPQKGLLEDDHVVDDTCSTPSVHTPGRCCSQSTRPPSWPRRPGLPQHFHVRLAHQRA